MSAKEYNPFTAMPDDDAAQPIDLDDFAAEAQEERMISEYNQTFPLRGDRLFVETQRGIRLDPLGMTDFCTGERSATGRREL